MLQAIHHSHNKCFKDMWWQTSHLPLLPVPVSVEAKLSFVDPGRRRAPSPSPSKAPGISYQGTMKTSVKMLKTFSSYPGKKYQEFYWGMDYGPICGLVLRRTTSPPPKLETHPTTPAVRFITVYVSAALPSCLLLATPVAWHSQFYTILHTPFPCLPVSKTPRPCIEP